MNDNQQQHQNEIDTGEPIAELNELHAEPSAGFLDRIRNSIQRRVFAADTVDFCLMGLFQILFDYLTMAVQAFPQAKSEEGERE